MHTNEGMVRWSQTEKYIFQSFNTPNNDTVIKSANAILNYLKHFCSSTRFWVGFLNVFFRMLPMSLMQAKRVCGVARYKPSNFDKLWKWLSQCNCRWTFDPRVYHPSCSFNYIKYQLRMCKNLIFLLNLRFFVLSTAMT